jgi:hypothetical protein
MIRKEELMKSLLSLVAAGAVMIFAGCNQSGTSGGPGATNTKEKTHSTVGQTENTFSLSVPTLATSLKQGETKEAKIGIKRGKNFDQKVAVSFENLPKGVTIEPAKVEVPEGSDEAKVSIKADDNAAIGDTKVKVIGHPTSGPDATNDMNIKVDKK